MSLLHPGKLPYEVEELGGGADRFNLSIRVNGYRVYIHVALENFVNSPREASEFSRVMRKAISDDGDNGDNGDMCWFGDCVAYNYLSQFEKLAEPSLESYDGHITLADVFPRGTYEGDFKVQDEMPLANEITKCIPGFPTRPEWDMRSIQSLFSLESASSIEVRVSEPTSLEDISSKGVFLRGARLYYRPTWFPGDSLREVGKYSALAAHEDIGIARLCGIVINEEGQSEGLLYRWIEAKDNGDGSLRAALKAGASPEQRAKWAKQVSETVMRLHSLSVIWGLVIPDNVMIDRDDNANVVDLAGGAWESVERDLLGLQTLEKFISTGLWST